MLGIYIYGFKNNRDSCGFMCAVFFSHHLGRSGCVPEIFRYDRQKGPVVDYRLRALYRVYRLSAIRIPQRQKV